MVQRQHSSAGFDVGFVATVSAELPKNGDLLGGDGRAAALHPCDARPPTADHAAIAAHGTASCAFHAGRERLALPGVDAQGRFALGGVRSVVCAAVPRFEAISGWDLARRQPKPAQRVAPPAACIGWTNSTPRPMRSASLPLPAFGTKPVKMQRVAPKGSTGFVLGLLVRLRP